MVSIYCDYRKHRYATKGAYCTKSVDTREQARAYLRTLRRHAIEAGVIVEYVEVREDSRLLWAWGPGAGM